MHEPTAKSFTKDASPTLPCIQWGEVWHVGWDIPSYWAMDSAGAFFSDYSAHGMCLSPTTVDELVRHVLKAEDESLANVILKLVDKKPIMPRWAKTALAAGWSPPAGWDKDQFSEY